jgi:hypothetical protein
LNFLIKLEVDKIINLNAVPLWGYKIHMTTASSIDMLGTLVADIGTVMAGTIPTVLAVVAALIGLGFAVHLVRKYIGRKI